MGVCAMAAGSKFVPIVLLGAVLAGVAGLLFTMRGNDAVNTQGPSVEAEALPRSAQADPELDLIIADLNAQACAARGTPEQVRRCVELRRVEQSAGFGPLPSDPGYQGCLRGELPERYCGDVRPDVSQMIRTGENVDRDYPLTVE